MNLALCGHYLLPSPQLKASTLTHAKHVMQEMLVRALQGFTLVLVQVQVLVLDLSSPTLLLFGVGNIFWTRLCPCVAAALLFLFIV